MILSGEMMMFIIFLLYSRTAQWMSFITSNKLFVNVNITMEIDNFLNNMELTIYLQVASSSVGTLERPH